MIAGTGFGPLSRIILLILSELLRPNCGSACPLFLRQTGHRGIIWPMIAAELLIEAYCSGVFPMAMENAEIGWFSPDPRAIIPLDGFHVPHRLERVLRKKP